MADPVDPINSAAQGMMGVVGATMIAGTSIAATGMLIKQIDKMGDNSYGMNRRKSKKSRSTKRTSSNIEKLVY